MEVPVERIVRIEVPVERDGSAAPPSPPPSGGSTNGGGGSLGPVGLGLVLQQEDGVCRRPPAHPRTLPPARKLADARMEPLLPPAPPNRHCEVARRAVPFLSTRGPPDVEAAASTRHVTCSGTVARSHPLFRAAGRR